MQGAGAVNEEAQAGAAANKSGGAEHEARAKNQSSQPLRAFRAMGRTMDDRDGQQERQHPSGARRPKRCDEQSKGNQTDGERGFQTGYHEAESARHAARDESNQKCLSRGKTTRLAQGGTDPTDGNCGQQVVQAGDGMPDAGHKRSREFIALARMVMTRMRRDDRRKGKQTDRKKTGNETPGDMRRKVHDG